MTRKKKKIEQMGIYLFSSDQGRQMALLLTSDVPISVRKFLLSITAWARNAALNEDAIESALGDDDEGGSSDAH